MKRITGLVFFLTGTLAGIAQLNKTAEDITREGEQLYRIETASWQGTDLFLEQCRHKKPAGYFSYLVGDSARCVFYSKDAKVMATIRFGAQLAGIDTTERAFTSDEQVLHKIREAALKLVVTDTFFLHYHQTGTNLIPVPDKQHVKVYVLTGPKKHGQLILGNDYLLTYSLQGELLSKKRIHQNMISFDYGGPADTAKATIHTHLPETGDFITATDICTLKLYSKFLQWDVHYVRSKNYTSVWDLNSSRLTIVPH